MNFLPALNPESTSKQISRSLQLYRSTFFSVLQWAVLCSLVVFLPRILLLAFKGSISLHEPSLAPERLVMVLLHIVSLIFFVAMLWRMQCKISHAPERLWDDLRKACLKAPRIIIAALIQTVCIFLINFSLMSIFVLFHQYYVNEATLLTLGFSAFLFFLQFLVGIYIYILFYFYLVLILNEDKSIMESLKYSAELVMRHWWQTFTVQLTPWVCYVILLMVIKFGLGINFAIYYFGHANLTLGATVLQLLIFAIFLPWMGSTMLVQLRDLELRRKVS